MAKLPKSSGPLAQCFKVPGLTVREIRALRSLETGDATPGEQQLALSIILKKFARTYDVHFIPGAPDESTFLTGRAFVGQEILKYLRFDPLRLQELEEQENQNVGND